MYLHKAFEIFKAFFSLEQVLKPEKQFRECDTIAEGLLKTLHEAVESA